MLIVGLVIAILIAAGLVFVFIKSVVFKLIAMALVVLTVVIIIGLSGDKIKAVTQPIGIDGNDILIYQEGEKIEFKAGDVSRIDVHTNVQTGKLTVSFVVHANIYSVPISSFAYEWGIKNALIKTFGNIVHDSTI